MTCVVGVLRDTFLGRLRRNLAALWLPTKQWISALFDWRPLAENAERRQVGRALLAGAFLASVGTGCARAPAPSEEDHAEAPEVAAPEPSARTEPGPRVQDIARTQQLSPLDPLPRPTNWQVLPPAFFRNAHNFYKVNAILVRALRRARYLSLADWLTATERGRWRYYSVRGGFAIVARIEKLRRDARPDYPRFGYSGESATLVEAVEGLLLPPVGYYRQIILVVSDNSLETLLGTETLTPQGAEELLRDGERTLPDSYWDDAFTPQHQVFALIYEFEKTSDTQRVQPLDRDHQIHSVDAHLRGSEILEALNE